MKATADSKAFADQMRALVPMHYTVLGTDWFDCLRPLVAVDCHDIAQAAVGALAAEGVMTQNHIARALRGNRVDPDKASPTAV
jgi:pyruvate dehydrogenase E1 component